MKNLTEDKLEEFIKKNKNEFNIYRPTQEHEAKFMAKLMIRLRRAVISIVPYLIKVAIGVIIIWGISLALWYLFNIPTLWDLFLNLLKK
jgi:hypothetical protein